MIGYLRGKIIEKHPNKVLLDVMGVGYDVAIPVSTYYQLPESQAETTLHIHTHVREDALALYGFRTQAEKKLFERLLGVSGVGPRLAITILSGIEPAELVPAIRGNNLVKLTHIPGVGKKTAERLVLELRDKLNDVEAAAGAAPGEAIPTEHEDVLSALLNLGYQESAAARAVQIAAEKEGAGGFDAVLKHALKLLAK